MRPMNSKQALCAGLVVLGSHLAWSAPTLQQRDDDCSKGPFNSGKMYGDASSGGNHFCETKWKQGLVVTGLEVWAAKDQIKGLQWTYEDGSKSLTGENIANGNTGNSHDRHDSITWNPTDVITGLTVYKNKVGDALGHIIITTNTSSTAKLDVSCVNWDPSSLEEVPLDTGILIGGWGQYSSMVNSIQWLFMKSRPKSAKMVSVSYTEDIATWNEKQRGIQTMDLESVIYNNTDPIGSPNQTYTFGESQKKTVTQQYSYSDTNTFGASISVTIGETVGVPEVAQVSTSITVGASYEYAHTSGQTSTWSSELALVWSQAGTIQPQTQVNCTAYTITGTFDSSYTSTVEITLQNGDAYDIQQAGHFASTTYTNSFSNCGHKESAEAPKVGASSSLSTSATVSRAITSSSAFPTANPASLLSLGNVFSMIASSANSSTSTCTSSTAPVATSIMSTSSGLSYPNITPSAGSKSTASTACEVMVSYGGPSMTSVLGSATVCTTLPVTATASQY